ncbi:hypothetical protein ACQP3C_31210, partial [Escherichia coli]
LLALQFLALCCAKAQSIQSIDQLINREIVDYQCGTQTLKRHEFLQKTRMHTASFIRGIERKLSKH